MKNLAVAVVLLGLVAHPAFSSDDYHLEITSAHLDRADDLERQERRAPMLNRLTICPTALTIPLASVLN